MLRIQHTTHSDCWEYNRSSQFVSLQLVVRTSWASFSLQAAHHLPRRHTATVNNIYGFKRAFFRHTHNMYSHARQEKPVPKSPYVTYQFVSLPPHSVSCQIITSLSPSQLLTTFPGERRNRVYVNPHRSRLRGRGEWPNAVLMTVYYVITATRQLRYAAETLIIISRPSLKVLQRRT